MDRLFKLTIRAVCTAVLLLSSVILILKSIPTLGTKNSYLGCLFNNNCDAPFSFQTSPFKADNFLNIIDESLTLEKEQNALEQALKVAPRNIAVRHALALNALKQGKYQLAISQLDNILRFRLNDRLSYFDTLLELASFPASAAAFKEVTSQSPTPKWIPNFINHASKTQTPNAIYKIAGHLPEGRQAFVKELIRNKKIEQAFLAWQQFSSPEELKNFSWPNDPNFANTKSNSPFGWKLHPKTTEQQENGLYSFFSGKGRTLAARQILLLGEGNYTFTANMSGHSKENGGYFKWRVTCPEINKEIGSIKTRDLNSSMKEYSFSFTVPESKCVYQNIELWGEAGEYPIISRTLVTSISLKLINSDVEN